MTVEDPAERLLRLLGRAAPLAPAADAVALWAASGAMALTGQPGGPPLVRTGPARAIDAALRALRALAPQAQLPDARLLGERAALLGLERQGDVSCGGGARLLPVADGWVAVALPRVSDLELVPALVGDVVPDGQEWEAVFAWATTRPAAEVRERARLLGLPVAVPGEERVTTPWHVRHERTGRPLTRPARVVDLSALWAGPLCCSLLRACGAEVVKVEDPGRPDGARRGDPAFFDLLNRGARSVPLDLQSRTGRARLGELVRQADVVVEGSRPRALVQLGVVAEEVVAETDVTWISITAHGREQGDRVGYGDDAAVAGGLVVESDGQPLFVGDAVADPLTGVHAALAAWAGVLTGGARLVDIGLSRVAAWADSLEVPAPEAQRDDGGWHVLIPQGRVPVAAPRARPPSGRGPTLPFFA